MKKPCTKCSQSGIYVDYIGYDPSFNSKSSIPYANVPCKYCNGTGWIDDEELITVPRKYVKDEYFKQTQP